MTEIIDDALIVATLLNTYWNETNVAKPAIFFDDRHISNQNISIKQHDFRNPAIKVYVVSPPIKTPVDIAYEYFDVTTTLAVDIKTSDRTNYLQTRDEVNRIFELMRRGPSVHYQVLLFEPPQLVSGYAGFWNYVIKITLKHYGKVI